ncbi:hypothetical protein N473_01300 [Pseudoalteromonas luteoviolacea CPMOR-1]|uniref:Uncharacterized protein n=1 Tax=Pseudoalteromonas luteoviolacea CPMOR-1 TaxID=1365248 RepID=A0A167LUH8_9GAMM|nr:hypothetical protein [Pseudoalteromonas luteoviolacea]KZN65238.1 hypothetical protein N473_01300 [Pseudoalteromonas luteoviolacea CPMOR-1]
MTLELKKISLKNISTPSASLFENDKAIGNRNPEGCGTTTHQGQYSC